MPDKLSLETAAIRQVADALKGLSNAGQQRVLQFAISICYEENTPVGVQFSGMAPSNLSSVPQ